MKTNPNNQYHAQKARICNSKQLLFVIVAISIIQTSTCHDFGKRSEFKLNDPPAPPAPAENPATHALEPGTPFPGYTLTTEEVYSMKSAEFFFSGMGVESFFKNTTECFYRVTNATFIQVRRLVHNYTELFPTIYDYLIDEQPPVPAHLTVATNTISLYFQVFVQNMTNHALVCNDALKNIYKWGNAKFHQFRDGVDFASAFFQNVIGKSLSFNFIYQNIIGMQDDVPANPALYGEFGKIVKILISFEPVSSSSYDLDDTFNFFENPDNQINKKYTQNGSELAVAKKSDDQVVNGLASTMVQRESINLGAITNALPYTMLLNFQGLYDFVRGILNGANLAKTGKMVDCLNNANSIMSGGNDTVNYLLSNLTLYGALITVDKALGVVYTAGGLSSDCVQGSLELSANAVKYADFVTKSNYWLLYWNFIYNFGLLYNSVKSVIFFFFLPDKNRIKTTTDLGIQIGSFAYNIFSS